MSDFKELKQKIVHCKQTLNIRFLFSVQYDASW